MTTSSSTSSTEQQRTEGYRGAALDVLRRHNASPGQVVSVKTADGMEARGVLLPRYTEADDEHIVVKLKSGYNVGIAVDSISALEVLGEPEISRVTLSPEKPPQDEAPPRSTESKRVALLSTGGTIASKIDYVTGAVHPALSAADLYAAVPELDRVARVEPEVVFSVLSENLNTSHWEVLSQKVSERIKRGVDGVVILSGTDILGYISAALSFSLLGIGKTIVCVGSQRSSDRPSSDAALNLLGAARFAAESGAPGVFVAMHASESDDDGIAIHLGSRVRKDHTSRRDAFESIDIEPVATVTGSQIYRSPVDTVKHTATLPAALVEEFTSKLKFEPATTLLKFYPGLDPRVLEFLVDSLGVKGIVLEGTGLGHVSSLLCEKISDLTARGVFVGMTSQCIWGHVDLNVYRTGRDLLQAGVVPLGNMLAETAFAKLSWALGNFPRDAIKRVMLTNLAGELIERLPI